MLNIINNSFESYLDKVEKESSMKKKQLTYLKELLERTNDNNYKITFMKITVPELYAQYEGFFKFIFLYTIEYIKQLKIPNNKLNKKYLIFTILTHLTSEITNQKTKAEKMLTIFDDAFNNNIGILHISNLEKYILNLDSTNHTMKILGIDNNKIPMRGLDLLYKRRCEIVHGNISESNPFYISSDVEITDYIVNTSYKYWEKHYECVKYAIDAMSQLFIDYIKSKKYMSI